MIAVSSLIEGVVVGIVAYRVWRLVAIDTITAGLRERVTRPGVWEFLQCPWCSGFWVAVIMGTAVGMAGWSEGSIYLAIPVASVVVGVLGDHL